MKNRILKFAGGVSCGITGYVFLFIALMANSKPWALISFGTAVGGLILGAQAVMPEKKPK